MLGLTPYYFDYTPTIRFAKIRDFYQRNNIVRLILYANLERKLHHSKFFSLKEIKTLCSTSQLRKTLKRQKKEASPSVCHFSGLAQFHHSGILTSFTCTGNRGSNCEELQMIN